MEKKKAGRPKSDKPKNMVTLNLRLEEKDRDRLREITEEQGNISDTDTIRRWIRNTPKPGQ